MEFYDSIGIVSSSVLDMICRGRAPASKNNLVKNSTVVRIVRGISSFIFFF